MRGKMKSKIFLLIVLIFMLFSLTGCYDANSIENSYYIVAIGIDSGKDDLYNISIQIAKNEESSSGSGASSQSSSYTIYQVECQTFESGISILNNYLNKTISLSHCSAIVFSQEIAQKGIGNIINSFSSNDEIRPSAYVLISNKSAYDVLNNVSNSGENFSSRFYEYIVTTANYTGYSEKTTFAQFLSRINSTSEDAVAIYAYVDDKTVQNIGLALFKGDKMVGTTEPLDSISHLILTNELKQALLTIPNPFESVSFIDLEIRENKKADIDVSMINNTPFINCTVYLHGNIKTSGENFDYTKPENIETVTYYAKKHLEAILYNYLYKISKDYDTDVLGFQRSLSKKCLTNSDLENYNFSKVFKDSYFRVKVNMQIESTYLFSKD